MAAPDREGWAEFAAHVNPLAAARAELNGEPRIVASDGTVLRGADGRDYVDMLAGYGTQALGVRRAAVAHALREHLAGIAPPFYTSGVSPYAGRLARRLAERTGYTSATFASGGSEAVEAALKLARAATGRPRLLGLACAYHGCTLGALSLMGSGPFRERFGPHLAGAETLPWDDAAALRRELARGDVAAVVIEPWQVEGGVRAPAGDYVAALCELTAHHGALLIADEVQSGLGRVGRLLASTSWPRPPDVIVLAKALGGGLLPLSVTLTSAEIFQRAYGSFASAETHSVTMGGATLPCVAGLAALDALDDALIERARRVGEGFRRALIEALAGLPLVREVRGEGLLVGIALTPTDHPWLSWDGLGLPEIEGRGPAIGMLLCHRLVRRGYLTHVAAHDWSVVRLTPALDLAEDTLAGFVTACREELEALANLV